MREYGRQLRIGPQAGRRVEVLVVSLSSSAGLLILWLAFGRKIAAAPPGWMIITALAAFLLTATLLLIARTKGIALIWFFLLLIWCGFLFGAYQASNGVMAFARHMPIRFAVWSFAALPLWASTEHVLARAARPSVVLGGCLWLAGVVVSARLGAYAPDVGGPPGPMIIWVLIGAASLVPLWIGIAMATRAWKRTGA